MNGFCIDGRPVPLVDWQANVEADWGDRSLTGRLPRFIPSATQGAPVELWTSNDILLWAGELTQDPRPEGDSFTIEAAGYAEKLAANRARMFYRIDGPEQWVEQDAEPHEFDYPTQFGLILKRSLMSVRMGNGGADSMTSPDGAGFVVWLEGADITRFSVLVNPQSPYTVFDFFTKRFNGPTGGRTDINSWTLNTASPTTRAADITTPQDALYFRVEATGSAASTVRRRVTFTQIKVYGRTNSNAFSASDVVTDVGEESGLDVTNVQDNSLEILPLDWVEDHPALLDHMAALTNWRWMARGDGLHFGPYERTWKSFTNRDCRADLKPEPRYNRVRIPFDAISGAEREATASPDVDPFPGEEVVWYGEELSQPQDNADLATAVAQAQVEYMSSRRMTGSVQLAQVRGNTGTAQSPYVLTAGDLLELPDLDPLIGPQRVQAVTYRPDGDVTADVGDAFNLVRTLANAPRDRKRSRRRRRGNWKRRAA